MRKYGKWLLVLGVLAASPAWVSADGFLSGSSSAQTSRTTQKQVNQHRAEQVAYALKQARLNGYDFEVEVRGDTVKLEGKVRDVTHRALASNVCRKVPGIQNIKNNIQYVPSGNIQQTGGSVQAGGLSTAAFSSAGNTGGIQQVRYSKPGRRSTSTKQTTTTTQQRFTQQVRQAAPSTPAPPALSYESAAPKTEAAPKQQATQAVEKQSDAAPATPFIDLTSSKSAAPAGPSNQQVAETIAQQLASVGLIGYDVTARFENGVATLAGEVATQDQRKAAEYATSMIPSVKNVVNQLQVKGPIAQTAFAGAGGQVTPASMSFAPQPMAQPGMMPAPAAMGPAGNYSNPQLPDHAWPAYAQYPNSAAIQYPKQYSASAWPYIGPFYPYPQVPLGWREVSMEWDDGMWQLDFNKKKDAWYWLFAPRNWH